jgi:hypothetical protein
MPQARVFILYISAARALAMAAASPSRALLLIYLPAVSYRYKFTAQV